MIACTMVRHSILYASCIDTMGSNIHSCVCWCVASCHMAFKIETITTYGIVGSATKIKWCVDKEVVDCEGVKYLKLARNY